MPTPVAQPPTQTSPLSVGANGKMMNSLSAPWLQWFVAAWTSLRAPANTTPPANSAASGVQGQIAFDQNFLYVAVGANKWKRIALTNF